VSGQSFEQLLRDAVRDELEEIVEEALGEQRRLMAPLASSAELLRRRAALSITETAEVLGVSERTVRRWIRDGELVPLDFSGDRRLIGADQILTKLAAANGRRRNCGEAPR
jgi:excisionase family DNA binding protein